MFIRSCLLVGAGGIGSHLAEPLVRLLAHHPQGTWNVTVCDGDTYSESNRTRQLFLDGMTGKNKAQALCKKLSSAGFPYVVAYPYYLNENNIWRVISELISPCLIICAVDNAATRKLTLDCLEEYTQNTGDEYIWVSPSNGWSETQTSVHLQLNHYQTPSPLIRYQTLREPEDYIPKDDGCFELYESSPQLISANFKAASDALVLINSILEDKPIAAEVSGDVFQLKSIPLGGLINYTGDN